MHYYTENINGVLTLQVLDRYYELDRMYTIENGIVTEFCCGVWTQIGTYSNNTITVTTERRTHCRVLRNIKKNCAVLQNITIK